ncbi:MAG: cysteine--tRNA ligase [Candidatus Pacearchaeota archaeon]|nr:cysteine--tRNA ligase [Candidatus Pacearchaeota archaeon]MDE1848952.1 cysteine--tRNA ligase [Nanoarchaeota archaeon]
MLKIYNTLTRKKETFRPINGKKVNLFACGPTVYDFAHVGHAKTFIQFDVIVKYLRWKGYKVFYLENITDIDDKIINRARERNISPSELAKRFESEFLKDMKSLGVDSVNKYAKATDYIKEIESQVKRLIERGYAYKISDGYYFDLSKDQDYGKLAKRKFEEAEDAVSRIDENKEKRNKGDFCLWKFYKEGDPYWESSLGRGRPGWHIEDTAITEKEFGPQYDIHGGAMDLIFPHHEAEIAQMESISGKKPLVRYWIHIAFLNIDKQKMSKSLGNFITIREALEKYDAKTLRFLFASNYHRTPMNFSYKKLEQSKNALRRLNDFAAKLRNSKEKDDLKLVAKARKNFEEAMDDDFDSSKAFQVIFDFVREVNKNSGGKKSYEFIRDVDRIFNVLSDNEIIPKEISKLAEEREIARKGKDWKKADEIRGRINKSGYLIEDSDRGPIIKKV